MKNRLLPVLTCICFLVGLPLTASAAPTGTLRVALTAFPTALDLSMAAEKNSSHVARQLQNALVWADDDGKIVPALAQSWEISESGTDYLFHLRKNVRFHNGEAFTADSVVFSWKRGIQDTIENSDTWRYAKSVEKVDDYTVRVTTEKPNPLLMRIIAENWGMVPPEYIRQVGEEGFLQHPVGTGPFKFVKWNKGDRIVLEANADYWEKDLPRVKNLIFRPIPESATRVAAIQTGEIDLVTRLSAEEAATLKEDPRVSVIDYTVDRVFYIAFNNLTTGKDKPTMSPLVRQAMNYAVDVDAIIDALFNGYGRPATGFITPGNLGYDKAIQPFGYDPQKAKTLLAEAGYKDGFKIGFACPAGAYANFEQVCEAIQGYLGEVGIQTELQILESGRYWDLESKKELPPLFGDSWSENTGEALTRLKGALGGNAASYSAWSDPEIDRLIDQIASTVDDNARSAQYVELQRYMQQNPPFIYLYEPVTFEAINPKVKSYKPRPPENYYLKAVEVVE